MTILNRLKCDECKWEYPSHLLNTLRTNVADQNDRALCGICALEISNKIHGVKRIKFDGQVAEYMRQQAVKWRKKHPYDDPAKKVKK